jgi:hypothetical protein
MAEIDRLMADYFRARDALEPVSREDLLLRLRDDLVTVLDVRPEDEFVVGMSPVPLINIPLAELERCLGELPKDREVIALLPRSLLRSLLRGGRGITHARLSHPPARGWLSRVEGCRSAN